MSQIQMLKLTAYLFFADGAVFIVAAAIGRNLAFLAVGVTFLSLGGVYLQQIKKRS